MRGASGESLAAVVGRLEQVVSAGADAGRVGDELFAVVRLLGSEPSLRRVWSDPATPEPAKAAFARSVLTGKVSEPAMDVVGAAVSARWSAVRDLADALEQVGVVAQVLAAERAGQLDELEDELFRFERIAAADPALLAILTDRRLPVERKQELVRTLLADRASAPTIRLVEQAVSGRHRSFAAALSEYQRVAAEQRQRLVATVTAAVALSEDEKTRLSTALARVYGRDIHLNVILDPLVIGGVRVEIGDEVIDGTLDSRLDDARRRIAG